MNALTALTRLLDGLPAPEKAIIVALFGAFALGVLDLALGAAAAQKANVFDGRLLAHNLRTFFAGTMLGLITAAFVQYLTLTAFGSILGDVAGGGFAAMYAAFLVQTRSDIAQKLAIISGSAAPANMQTVTAALSSATAAAQPVAQNQYVAPAAAAAAPAAAAPATPAPSDAGAGTAAAAPPS